MSVKKTFFLTTLLLLVGSFAYASESNIQVNRRILVNNSFESVILFEECDEDSCSYWAPLEVTNFDGGVAYEISALQCEFNNQGFNKQGYRMIGGVPYVCTKLYDVWEDDWHNYADQCKFVYTEYEKVQ